MNGVYWLVLITSTCVLSLGALELLFRAQVVDTYAPELNAYNSVLDLTPRVDLPVVLFMGDSFTAGLDNFPSLLRQVLPNAAIVNAGISGSGVIEAGIVAPSRFDRFRPTIFVYQIYVGNDLFDISYPVAWERVNLARNVYWGMASHFRSLAFLNYRFGQLASQLGVSGTAEVDPAANARPFSPEKYTPTLRIHYLAEPKLIEDSVLLRGSRAHDFSTLLDRLSPLLARCSPEDCAAYVLVIPHCAQVSSACLQNMRAIGAVFDDPALMQEVDYPFVRQLSSFLQGMPNVTVLSAISALREAENRGDSVYYSNDSHLSETGKGAIASFLTPYLASSLDNRIPKREPDAPRAND